MCVRGRIPSIKPEILSSEPARVSSAPKPFVRPAATPPERGAAARDRIERRLADCVSASDEAHLLLEISTEAGARGTAGAVGERLLSVMDSAAFEDELRFGPDMAGRRLRRLAALRVRIVASPLTQGHQARACAILRRIEALIHADAVRAAQPNPGRASKSG